MIRLAPRKRFATILGASFFASLISLSAVFAQSMSDQAPSTAALLRSPAALVTLGGFLLVVLVINFLVVFLVNPKDFPRKEFMGKVWPITKAHLWFLIGVLIFQQLFVQLPTVLTAIVQAVMNIPNDEPVSSGLNYVLSFVLSVMVQSGFIALVLHLIDGVPAHFSDLFSQFSIFFRYLGATILYGLIVGVGLLLLIVPGMIWLLKYSLWPYFLVDKKVSVLDSLKMSAAATKGHKWSLFSLYAFLTALNLLGICVFVVGFLVTAPMTALILAYVYRKLTGSASAAPVSIASFPA